jgi:hypothetical protein
MLAGVSSIGEDAFDEGKDRARGLQQRATAIAVLNACRMRFEHETAPIHINERMTLASVDLLAGIIAAWSAGFRCLYALAIDNGG